MGSSGSSNRFHFGGSKITADGDCSHKIKRHLLLGKKAMTNLDSILKSRDKGLHSQRYGFSNSHVWMWKLDVFELRCWRRLLRVPWSWRRSNQSILKGNKLWIFTGRTDAEAEAPILWSPDAKNWLTGKGPDAGKDWGQEEKQGREGEMVGWHHQLNGH